jgi:hypothetical protein
MLEWRPTYATCGCSGGAAFPQKIEHQLRKQYYSFRAARKLRATVSNND